MVRLGLLTILRCLLRPFEARPQSLRPLTTTELDRLCARLRALHLPWLPSTEAYIRDALGTRIGPLIPIGTDPTIMLDDLDRRVESLSSNPPHLGSLLERLYSRSFLDPKSNIGTLDTTFCGSTKCSERFVTFRSPIKTRHGSSNG